ncbi:MAG: gliding motility protein GldN [Bacteroidetes bacterium]|nr:gliding motility protein GldN [Bacteroidota bacterium]
MKRISIILILLFVLIGAQKPSTAQVYNNEPPVDGLFADGGGFTNTKPVAYPPLRKADVMWEKRIWRVIDMRQKINQPFYYPIEPHNHWRNLITVIMDALKEGTITAYDISTTDEFLVPLTYQEVINRQVDTMHKTFKRPYPPYDEFDSVIFTQFDPSKILRFRIKEDWYFDKQRSQLMVRIIGLCPVMMKEINGEEFPEPLFWVYFPEARPVFAKSLVYNRHNDAMRLSYDDVFWKRMFGSLIYKESNVYDRRISEYASGLEALYEAERVKNDLMRFEHELWEF